MAILKTQRKRSIVLLTALVVAIAIATPVVLAIGVAYQEAQDAEIERMFSLARDILGRSDRTGDQVELGIRRLVANQGNDPSSESNRQLMWQIALTSSSIQAIGYVENDRMVCSSLFGKGQQFDLGPVDIVQPSGVRLRYNVVLPFAKGSSFIAIERDHYAAVINKDIPIDVTTGDGEVTLATVSRGGSVLTSHGRLDPQWLNVLNDKKQSAFIADGYVVAVLQSTKYFIGAVAAVPVNRLYARMQEKALLLVPIGLVAGLALTLVLWYMMRLQTAMPTVIRAALRRREFFIVYQPLVELSTGRWIGAEALIRWRRSSGDLVRPDVFVPVAEDNGLSPRLTQHVLELIENDAATLFKRFPDFHLAVNLSPTDLKSSATVDLLKGFSRRLGASSNRIVAEATERGLMNADETKDVLRGLREAGIQVAIDDFGTGYSSLSYLETFEIDYLKIDKSFVDTVGTGAATSHVIPHIIEMAKSLGLAMIAEGVETAEQAHYLRERGVQFAQGWLFGKPMRFHDLMDGLARSSDR
jgi:sensor c-di-GMP phosphodiesterase-like protein